MIPGMIDLQVNGFNGVNFSGLDLTPDDIQKTGDAMFRLGVAGYCPTVITAPMEVYERNLPMIAAAAESKSGAQILGIHLEGPFLSPDDGPRGIHPLDSISPPSRDLFDRLYEMAGGKICLLTLSPDVDGAIDLIEHITGNFETVVSLGHHRADADTISAAADAGARACTHVGNGMAEMIHRHNNPIWPMLAEDRLAGMFITDGHHLPNEFIRVALRAKGVERFIAVSDTTHIAGFPPGEYDFNGVRAVLEPSGRLHRKGAYQLSGSASTMLDCLNVLHRLGEVEEEALGKMVCGNALKLLGATLDGSRQSALPRVELDDGRYVAKAGPR
jgi:N-acetylglucosamine-6-phosphate deacetylase